MPTQLERVEAHASHLLDGFLLLRERYALLDPMLFSSPVVSANGSGRRARGFRALRHTLFLACAQDIAKLISDADPRAPSIHNIAAALRDDALVATLRARYAVWVVPSIESESDPEIVEALRLLELGERAQRGSEFDAHLRDLLRIASELQGSQTIEAFRTIRDKLTAHTEVRFVADKYRLTDIADLGIKWRDLQTAIASLQRAIELVGMVVRNAGFAWEGLDRQLSRAANDFWLPAGAG
jgi:AbiU2